MRFVTEAEVAAVFEWRPLIGLMRQTMIDFSAGRCVQPVRARMAYERGLMMTMPAYTGEAIGMKTLLFHPGHEMCAVVVMFDVESGAPRAMLEAETLTAFRTAAVSAVATELLARASARVLTILGTGTQARSHIEALPQVRNFDEIRIWGRDVDKARRLAVEHAAAARMVRAVSSAEDAVRGADVVATVTASRQPVLHGSWLDAGVHVNAVGAPAPDWRELDDEAMANAVYVDSLAGAMEESGDVLLSGAQPRAELGTVLAAVDSGPDRAETSVFKSLGMGVQDVAAADWILRRLPAA